MNHWQRLRNWIRARCLALRRNRQAARTLGRRGELAAEQFLRKRGFRVIDRSSRGGLGEIDLVAVVQRTIVFVEVKTRRSNHRGDPADAVDLVKQRRLTRLALAWLKRHDLLEHPARFDVVAVIWPFDDAEPRIVHYEHAFPAVGRGTLFS